MSANTRLRSRGVNCKIKISIVRLGERYACLAGDTVNKIQERCPRWYLELHDVDADTKGWRSQVARAKCHGYDAFVVGHVKSQGWVDAKRGLKMWEWASKSSTDRDEHTQYGFPVSVVAKVIASLGRPRFLSNTRGKRLPMRHPAIIWFEQMEDKTTR